MSAQKQTHPRTVRTDLELTLQSLLVLRPVLLLGRLVILDRFYELLLHEASLLPRQM